VIPAALPIASAAAFAAGAAVERHTAAGDSQPAPRHTEAGTRAESSASADTPPVTRAQARTPPSRALRACSASPRCGRARRSRDRVVAAAGRAHPHGGLASGRRRSRAGHDGIRRPRYPRGSPPAARITTRAAALAAAVAWATAGNCSAGIGMTRSRSRSRA